MLLNCKFLTYPPRLRFDFILIPVLAWLITQPETKTFLTPPDISLPIAIAWCALESTQLLIEIFWDGTLKFLPSISIPDFITIQSSPLEKLQLLMITPSQDSTSMPSVLGAFNGFDGKVVKSCVVRKHRVNGPKRRIDYSNISNIYILTFENCMVAGRSHCISHWGLCSKGGQSAFSLESSSAHLLAGLYSDGFFLPYFE